VSLSVGLSVRKVYCDIMADWIRMLFGVVSGVGRGMDVLDGDSDDQRGRGNMLFPNYFGEDLFTLKCVFCGLHYM